MHFLLSFMLFLYCISIFTKAQALTPTHLVYYNKINRIFYLAKLIYPKKYY